ncbi:MAG TPA: hypothetical protein DCP71_16290 [Verrucomicrobiales bacterium]|nr:hypothetical protein [Verrucomicrobiales bacterium]
MVNHEHFKCCEASQAYAFYGRGLRLAVLMSSLAFQAFSQESYEGQDWAPLIQAANAISLTNPMLLRDTPEAAALHRGRSLEANEAG